MENFTGTIVTEPNLKNGEWCFILRNAEHGEISCISSTTFRVDNPGTLTLKIGDEIEVSVRQVLAPGYVVFDFVKVLDQVVSPLGN